MKYFWKQFLVREDTLVTFNVPHVSLVRKKKCLKLCISLIFFFHATREAVQCVLLTNRDSPFPVLCGLSWKSSEHPSSMAGRKSNAPPLFSPALPATPDTMLLYDPLAICASALFSILTSYCPVTGKELWVRVET